MVSSVSSVLTSMNFLLPALKILISTIGFVNNFSGPVMSFYGKQSIIADSSAVAEFIDTHQVWKIIAWVRNLLSEMN